MEEILKLQKQLEPALTVAKQWEERIPSGLREVLAQQKQLTTFWDNSILSQISQHPLIDWSQFTPAAVENLFKAKSKLEKRLSSAELARLKSEASEAQARLKSMLKEPTQTKEVTEEVEKAITYHAEIMEAVMCGDEEKFNQLADEECKKTLINFYFFIYPLILSLFELVGIPVKNYLEPSEERLFCRQFNIEDTKNAEARRVCFPNNTLNVHKYDRLTSEVLAVLPNGTRICLPYKPKGNAQWIKIHAFNDDGEVIIGYVQARYTERFYF